MTEDDYLNQRAWRAEEFVGRRIHDRREELGMTQEEFGQKLLPALGTAWSRQTVSAAEKGKRAFTAGELLAIAQVLNVRIPRLLTPPIDVMKVQFPSGITFPSRTVTEMGVADSHLAAMWADLSRARAGIDQASEAVSLLERKLNAATLATLAATIDRPDAESGE